METGDMVGVLLSGVAMGVGITLLAVSLFQGAKARARRRLFERHYQYHYAKQRLE